MLFSWTVKSKREIIIFRRCSRVVGVMHVTGLGGRGGEGGQGGGGRS